MTETLLAALSAALLAAVFLLMRSVSGKNREIAGKDVTIQGLEKDVHYAKEQLEGEKASFAQRLEDERKAHEQQLRQLSEENEKSLQAQIAAVKAQISSESEKVLKAREEEFTKKAKESFGTIAGDFNKNLKDMKDAFEANKKTQNETSAQLGTKIGEAVKQLQDQTNSVAQKADHLASALKGQNKMQGCWGETQLGNILNAEGLSEGRDYDREETLRDELGIVLHNEDSGKRMRPDFILHYPDNTDIIIDCKVSLAALSDYFSAGNDAERADASARNLAALKEQVNDLSRKDYSSYLSAGHKCLDFTVMFVPNVNALILARQEDPHLIADAYRKNVLITSEETLMPFLRLVRSAWVNFDQARNQERLVAAAQKMVDRVGLFCESYAKVGGKIQEAAKAFEEGDVKLRESGQSILRAAREVEQLGVKSKKNLPPMIGE